MKNSFLIYTKSNLLELHYIVSKLIYTLNHTKRECATIDSNLKGLIKDNCKRTPKGIIGEMYIYPYPQHIYIVDSGEIYDFDTLVEHNNPTLSKNLIFYVETEKQLAMVLAFVEIKCSSLKCLIVITDEELVIKSKVENRKKELKGIDSLDIENQHVRIEMLLFDFFYHDLDSYVIESAGNTLKKVNFVSFDHYQEKYRVNYYLKGCLTPHSVTQLSIPINYKSNDNIS